MGIIKTTEIQDINSISFGIIWKVTVWAKISAIIAQVVWTKHVVAIRH